MLKRNLIEKYVWQSTLAQVCHHGGIHGFCQRVRIDPDIWINVELIKVGYVDIGPIYICRTGNRQNSIVCIFMADKSAGDVEERKVRNVFSVGAVSCEVYTQRRSQ